MSATSAALLAGGGVYLLYAEVFLGHRSPARRSDRRRAAFALARERSRSWLAQAGLDGIRLRDFALAVGSVCFVTALVATAFFGSPLVGVVAGVLTAGIPVELARQRRRARRLTAREAWPKLIDEVRVLTSSVGRSIPQALFEAGGAAPDELRPAFEAAHREWLISTDFTRTIAVLEDHLGDACADTTGETLLVAHELGGADLDRRLADLAADRRMDLRHRKDAAARQAGVRFARRFVLIVPLGMALAGSSVGDGRDAYGSPQGQLAVVAALGTMAVCWVWAGRLMRLPDEPRVFRRR